MEPYKRRDAEKLYNDLLQQVHQQMISYREITNNKLSMIEEMLESLVQEVKVDSMVKEENEHEEFMNPIVSKEWNTRSLSHLQIMFPKLEGAEVIKCSPDSEQQEFTGNPIYDEEPGEGQECWPEKEFILAALNGRNPKSSKLVQPEICTSERPEASEELSYTQVTQNRKIIAREMIRENPKKNGDNLFEVKKLDLSHEWEDECPVDDCVHDTYKEDLEGIDLAYDSRMVFTFGVFPRVKMKFTVLLVVIALNRSNGIGGSDHGNEKGLKGFSIDSLMDGVSEVVSNTTAAAAIERVTLLIQNQYESSNYEEVEQNTPLSAILKPSPKATLSEQGPLCGNGSSGDMGIAEFLDLILACSNESPWNILAELPTSAPNILTWLEQAYCESIGYEYIHLADRTQYNWLRDKIETPTPMQYNRQRREVILDRLIWSIQFENFLATKWTAAKRFGLEGDETLIHGIKEMFDRSADLGVKSIVIGMSHRGRLNVLGNVARKPLGQIFYEFINGTKPVDEVGLYTGTEDVKYHLGTSYDWPTRGGKRIQLSLDANPSHLEAVDPLVVGKTRAKQYYSNDVDMTNNMGILIHGDGSFAGQGVVYETLHLSALPNYTTEETKDILLLDVAPLALGIETVGGVMTKKCQTFTTYQDQQTPISIQVFEGERSLTKNCRLPGKFDLPGIAPAPRETPRIEVTFEVDAKGILNIKAEDKASCKSEKITITNDNGRPSQEEIERMVQEAGEFAEEDKKIKEKIDARNRLETYIYNMKNQINDKDKLADKLESDEKEKIDTAVKKALEWLDDNQSAEKKDYDEKLKEVEAVCNPIITAVTIFDPGGRKWSHEINHEDMVVFQGGRIVRNAGT